MDSAVDHYLAREFTKDNDADMYRSNFFYTNNVDPSSAGKFFMGPIWDFDRSAGAKHPSDTSVDLSTGWWMRGNGSPNRDTNKTHWDLHGRARLGQGLVQRPLHVDGCAAEEGSAAASVI